MSPHPVVINELGKKVLRARRLDTFFVSDLLFSFRECRDSGISVFSLILCRIFRTPFSVLPSISAIVLSD